LSTPPAGARSASWERSNEGRCPLRGRTTPRLQGPRTAAEGTRPAGTDQDSISVGVLSRRVDPHSPGTATGSTPSAGGGTSDLVIIRVHSRDWPRSARPASPIPRLITRAREKQLSRREFRRLLGPENAVRGWFARSSRERASGDHALCAALTRGHAVCRCPNTPGGVGPTSGDGPDTAALGARHHAMPAAGCSDRPRSAQSRKSCHSITPAMAGSVAVVDRRLAAEAGGCALN
jgi:hypothetical protein